ncbi:MAG TPA: type II toxin-antitoxin system HicB family antitoxin [Polyangia bacterium]|nr:type II toxin-antitoxin system HicB family antitoxin [Polyangia bacterium]
MAKNTADANARLDIDAATNLRTGFMASSWNRCVATTPRRGKNPHAATHARLCPKASCPAGNKRGDRPGGTRKVRGAKATTVAALAKRKGGAVVKEEPFRYRILIEWSDENRAFIARIPALPGCIAHGPTADEAKHEAQLAGTLMLETLEEQGLPTPPADAPAD